MHVAVDIGSEVLVLSLPTSFLMSVVYSEPLVVLKSETVGKCEKL